MHKPNQLLTCTHTKPNEH